MALIYPSEKVARHWDGALRTRLRRAPLEYFLNAQGFARLPPGSLQVSDNLVRATVFLMQESLSKHCCSLGQSPHDHEHSAIGHTACLVSRAAATVIGEPSEWRVAALQSTSHLLRPHLSPTAAAVAAASLVRLHEASRGLLASSLATTIGEAIAVLLLSPSTVADGAVAALIAESLHLEFGEDTQLTRPPK